MGVVVKIIVLPTAKADLHDIIEFIAKGSIKYAQLEKRLIIGAVNQLYTNPFLGKPFYHNAIEARQLSFRNYLIIYRLKSEGLLEILTIHHHSRSMFNNPAFKHED